MLVNRLLLVLLCFLGSCASSLALEKVDGVLINPKEAKNHELYISVQVMESSCPGAFFVDVIAPEIFRGQDLKESLLHVRNDNEYIGRFWLGANSALNFCLSEELLGKARLDLIYASGTKNNLIIEGFEGYIR